MTHTLDRRHFLIAGGLTALASTRAFGANDRLRIGVIGAGGRMRALLNAAESSGIPFEIVSVCDVYTPRREEVKSRTSAAAATTCVDYNDVLSDKSIDAVLIATPDHWHVRIARAALAAGKMCTSKSRLRIPSKKARRCGRACDRAARSCSAECSREAGPTSGTRLTSSRRRARSGHAGAHILVAELRIELGSQPVDLAQLDWNRWLGGAPDQPFSLESTTTGAGTGASAAVP